jgi:hypothetical protein
VTKSGAFSSGYRNTFRKREWDSLRYPMQCDLSFKIVVYFLGLLAYLAADVFEYCYPGYQDNYCQEHVFQETGSPLIFHKGVCFF